MVTKRTNPPSLAQVCRTLRERYGPPVPPPTRDPFELVLFENVAYLASPERRREAFHALRDEIGTAPRALLRASSRALQAVTARGILKGTSERKLRECARVALRELDDSLDAIVAGPVPAAKKALCRFPGIGGPGADKVLLLCGRHASLAPESNGLRVLARLGIVAERKSYAQTYAATRTLTVPGGVRAMLAAHLLLQRHGQTVCRNKTPLCEACPLRSRCGHARGVRASRV